MYCTSSRISAHIARAASLGLEEDRAIASKRSASSSGGRTRSDTARNSLRSSATAASSSQLIRARVRVTGLVCTVQVLTTVRDSCGSRTSKAVTWLPQ